MNIWGEICCCQDLLSGIEARHIPARIQEDAERRSSLADQKSPSPFFHYNFHHRDIASWLAYRAPTTVSAIIGEAAYESWEGVSPETRIQESEKTHRQNL